MPVKSEQPLVAKVQYEEPCIFFLSYARNDADEQLDRFFADLCKHVSQRLGLSNARRTGFRDVREIESGDRWPDELSRVLSTCRVFLALYSPSYFKSEYAGKEWSAFYSRIINQASLAHPLIIPVLWLPLGTQFENLPQAIREIQYTYQELGETYSREGLHYLLCLEEQKDNYQKFLIGFSKK